MSIGPTDVVVLVFPAQAATDRVLETVADLVRDDAVRLLDAVIMSRDAEGKLDVRDFETDRPAALRDLPVEPVVMFNDEDLEFVADQLDPRTTALVMAVEHRWAERVADSVRSSGGEVALHLRIPVDVAEAAFNAAS